MVAIAMPRKPTAEDRGIARDLQEAKIWRDRPKDELIQIGRRLGRIRDSRSWSDRFPTFKEFCREAYGLTESRVNQLIRAAKLAQTLAEATGTSPRSERITRILANSENGLDDRGRIEAWKKALELDRSGNPSAAQLKGAIAFVRLRMEHEGRQPPEPTSNTGIFLAKTGRRKQPKEIHQLEPSGPRTLAAPAPSMKRGPGRPRKVRVEEPRPTPGDREAPRAAQEPPRAPEAPQPTPQPMSDLEAILGGFSITVNPKDYR